MRADSIREARCSGKPGHSGQPSGKESGSGRRWLQGSSECLSWGLLFVENAPLTGKGPVWEQNVESLASSEGSSPGFLRDSTVCFREKGPLSVNWEDLGLSFVTLGVSYSTSVPISLPKNENSKWVSCLAGWVAVWLRWQSICEPQCAAQMVSIWVFWLCAWVSKGDRECCPPCSSLPWFLHLSISTRVSTGTLWSLPSLDIFLRASNGSSNQCVLDSHYFYLEVGIFWGWST